jgi:Carboxymuconolactone decarboxylase family
MVAPALERYTQGPLLGDLWKHPDLSPRDRSIIAVAALIARNQIGCARSSERLVASGPAILRKFISVLGEIYS